MFGLGCWGFWCTVLGWFGVGLVGYYCSSRVSGLLWGLVWFGLYCSGFGCGGLGWCVCAGGWLWCVVVLLDAIFAVRFVSCLLYVFDVGGVNSVVIILFVLMNLSFVKECLFRAMLAMWLVYDLFWIVFDA